MGPSQLLALDIFVAHRYTSVRLLLLLFFLSCRQFLFGQYCDSTRICHYKFNNTFYYYEGKRAFDISLDTRSQKDTLFNSSSLLYKVNQSTSRGMGFSYKWISAELNLSTSYLYGLKAGEYFSLGGSFNRRSWGLGGYIQNYSGLLGTGDSSKAVVKDNTRYMRIGSTWRQYFNSSRYSWRAQKYCSERQRRSAGSPFAFTNIEYFSLRGGESLIADSINHPRYFGKQTGLRDCSGIRLSAMPGYALTISLFKGRWFLSPAIGLGTGLVYNTYHSAFGKSHSLSYTFNSLLEMGFGFNGNRLYASIIGFQYNDYSLINPTIIHVFHYGSVFTLGWRFGVLESKIPEDPWVWYQNKRKA